MRGLMIVDRVKTLNHLLGEAKSIYFFSINKTFREKSQNFSNSNITCKGFENIMIVFIEIEQRLLNQTNKNISDFLDILLLIILSLFKNRKWACNIIFKTLEG